MIEIIKEILPNEINKKILLFLATNSNWKIAKDKGSDKKLLEDLLGPNGKNSGFFLETFNELHKINIDTPLNLYAEIIYESIKNKTKYKFIKPIRFIWNYYCSNSETNLHTDKDTDNYISFVYCLNENNGGTEINGKFIHYKESEALIFPSNIIHKGISATDVKSRFNLNCIVEIERTNGPKS
jgi:hypothetical protein